MFVVDVFDDGTHVLLIDSEICSFRTSAGPVTVKADAGTGPILATFRASASGELWLGSWRRVSVPVVKGRVVLAREPLFSDRLCRSLAHSTDPRVALVHAIQGPAAIVAGSETLVGGKSLPTYVMPTRWLRPRSPRRGRNKKKDN